MKQDELLDVQEAISQGEFSLPGLQKDFLMTRQLLRLLKRYEEKVWDKEREDALLSYLESRQWSITRFGHVFIGRYSGCNLLPINAQEPLLSIKFWEGGAQFEVSAELSQFTEIMS